MTKKGAYYWSRIPGKFVHKETGEELSKLSFSGNVQEWYMTLYETIRDIDNLVLKEEGHSIHIGPDVACILESLPQFKPLLKETNYGFLGTIGKYEVFQAFLTNIIHVEKSNGEYAEIIIKDWI